MASIHANLKCMEVRIVIKGRYLLFFSVVEQELLGNYDYDNQYDDYEITFNNCRKRDPKSNMKAGTCNLMR